MKLEYIIKTIEKELEKSYSHKPHLADLPYDRRSTNPDELQERIDEIDNRLKKEEKNELQLELSVSRLEKDKEAKEKELKDEEKNRKKALSDLSNVEGSIDYIEKYHEGMNRENAEEFYYELQLHEKEYLPTEEQLSSPKELMGFLQEGLDNNKFSDTGFEPDKDRVENWIPYLQREIDRMEKADVLKDDLIDAINEIPFDEIYENPEKYYGRGVTGSYNLNQKIRKYSRYVSGNVVLDFDEGKDNESSAYPRAWEVLDYMSSVGMWNEHSNVEMREATDNSREIQAEITKIDEDINKDTHELQQCRTRIKDYKDERKKTEAKKKEVEKSYINITHKHMHDKLRTSEKKLSNCRKELKKQYGIWKNERKTLLDITKNKERYLFYENGEKIVLQDKVKKAFERLEKDIYDVDYEYEDVLNTLNGLNLQEVNNFDRLDSKKQQDIINSLSYLSDKLYYYNYEWESEREKYDELPGIRLWGELQNIESYHNQIQNSELKETCKEIWKSNYNYVRNIKDIHNLTTGLLKEKNTAEKKE